MEQEKAEDKKKARTPTSKAQPRSIDIGPFIADSINSISDLPQHRVSPLCSTPVSTSQISPAIVPHTPIQYSERKTRQALPDKFEKQGKLCCYLAHNRDFHKLEEALRCRLISRLEFECLKLKREYRYGTFHQLYDIREILLLLRSDNQRECGCSSKESSDSEE